MAGCLKGRSSVDLMLLDISVKQATDNQMGLSISNKPTSNFLYSVTIGSTKLLVPVVPIISTLLEDFSLTSFFVSFQILILGDHSISTK